MRNITLRVSDDTYRDARVWAARRDTSISAVVQYLLQTLPTIARAARAFPKAHQSLVKPSPAPSTTPPTAN